MPAEVEKQKLNAKMPIITLLNNHVAEIVEFFIDKTLLSSIYHNTPKTEQGTLFQELLITR